MDLKNEQRTVARGVFLGILGIFTVVGGTYRLLEPISGMETAIARLFLALCCGAFALVPLVVGIAAVGNSRFLTSAINPLAGIDTGRITIYSKYLSNTLEQLCLFLPTMVVLSLFLSAEDATLLPALTANFIIGRFIFFGGYLLGPLYRAPGFAMTMYPTMACLIYDLYQIATLGVPRI